MDRDAPGRQGRFVKRLGKDRVGVDGRNRRGNGSVTDAVAGVSQNLLGHDLSLLGNHMGETGRLRHVADGHLQRVRPEATPDIPRRHAGIDDHPAVSEGDKTVEIPDAKGFPTGYSDGHFLQPRIDRDFFHISPVSRCLITLLSHPRNTLFLF